MPSQPEQRDPALLDGASSRFASAFTRRTTQTREGGAPGSRPWFWLAAASGVTAGVILIVFLVARIPSGDEKSGNPEAAGPGSSMSPVAHGSPGVSGSPRVSGSPVVSGSPLSHGFWSPGAHLPSGAARGDDAPNSPTATASTSASRAGQPTATTSAGSKIASSSSGSTTSGSTSGSKSPTPGTSSSKTPSTPPGVLVIGNASNRCLTASGSRDGVGRDGTRLEIRDCDGRAWQRFDIRSDGTMRALGLCVDVAGANTSDGTPIQLARCNGGWAQKFIVNRASDLVNTELGKCADVVDKATGNGAKIQLWTCYGTSNQKWHKG